MQKRCGVSQMHAPAKALNGNEPLLKKVTIWAPLAHRPWWGTSPSTGPFARVARSVLGTQTRD